jgi:hypothetical protein
MDDQDEQQKFYKEQQEYFNWLNNEKNSEYDWFEPFLVVPWKEFTFIPQRYEVWEKGKMIKSGTTNGLISGIPANVFGRTNMEITVFVTPEVMGKYIFPSFIFDVLFSQKDRLQLASIPPEKPFDSNGIISLRDEVTGVTTPNSHKSDIQPYCSGLFFRNKKLVQISFSLNSPTRLIEFHGDGITKMNLHVPAAHK